MTNPNCDGGSTRNCAEGETRRYELGSAAGIYLCRACWDRENAYRAERAATGIPENWPQEDWDAATPYDGAA